jgi:outer membrane protein assembly factor BamB
MAPATVTIDGVPQVVSVTQAGVIGVSPGNGRILWEYPWTGGRSGGIMPIPHGDSLVVSATSAGIVSIAPRRRGDVWTVSKAWDTTAAEMYISHPVIVGDVLYVFSRRANGQLFALDVRDGRVLWLGEPRFATNVAFAKAGDLLFVLKDEADLIVARASPSGFTPLRNYHVADSATWAQPVISGRRLFIKDTTGVTLWTFD